MDTVLSLPPRPVLGSEFPSSTLAVCPAEQTSLQSGSEVLCSLWKTNSQLAKHQPQLSRQQGAFWRDRCGRTDVNFAWHKDRMEIGI